MLVGNKVDLRHLRAIEKDSAANFAEQNKMHFVETSALNATNVDVAFESTLRKIYEMIRDDENDKHEYVSEQASMLSKQLNGEVTVKLKDDSNSEKGASRVTCCS